MPAPTIGRRNDSTSSEAMSGHLVHATIHHLVPAKTPRYFTFIRQPAPLAVSQYNHDASRTDDPPTLLGVVRSPAPQPTTGGFEQRLGGSGRQRGRGTARASSGSSAPPRNSTSDLPHIFEAIGVPLDLHESAGRRGRRRPRRISGRPSRTSPSSGTRNSPTRSPNGSPTTTARMRGSTSWPAQPAKRCASPTAGARPRVRLALDQGQVVRAWCAPTRAAPDRRAARRQFLETPGSAISVISSARWPMSGS